MRSGWAAFRTGLLLGCCSHVAPGQREQRPGGEEDWQVLWSNRSQFGNVQAVRMNVNSFDVRFLLHEDTVIGARFEGGPMDGQDLFGVFTLLESLIHLKPSPERVLVLGLGAGSVPTAIGRAQLLADVIELNPAIVEVAGLHFGFSTSGQTIVGDVREVLQRHSAAAADSAYAGERYGLIIHDLHSGLESLSCLTEAVLTGMRDTWLTTAGVLAVNFLGFVKAKPDSEESRALPLSMAVSSTLRAVFPHVRCCRELPPKHQPFEVTNIVCLASRHQWALDVPEDQAAPKLSPRWLASRFHRWKVLTRSADVDVITEQNLDRFRDASEIVAKHLRRVARRDIIPNRRFWAHFFGQSQGRNPEVDEL